MKLSYMMVIGVSAVGAVALWLSPPASAVRAYLPPLSDFKRCDTAQDCVLVHSACGGWMPVSRAQEKQASDYFKAQEAHVQCFRDASGDPPPAFGCWEHTCEINKAANWE